MIKAKFRDHVRSKSDMAMVNEVLCKIICHSICCFLSSSAARPYDLSPPASRPRPIGAFFLGASVGGLGFGLTVVEPAREHAGTATIEVGHVHNLQIRAQHSQPR
jgi:hypothetical protein